MPAKEELAGQARHTIHQIGRRATVMARATGSTLQRIIGSIPFLGARFFPVRRDVDGLERAFAALQETVETLQARVYELQDRCRMPLPGSGAMTLNLTTKALALKLARNGQDARQIASVLGVPVGEIILLLKVQRFQSRSAPVEVGQPLNKASVIPIKKTEPEPVADGKVAAASGYRNR
jgi:hypothetical protein